MKRLIACAVLLLVATVVFGAVRERSVRGAEGDYNLTVFGNKFEHGPEALRRQYLERQKAIADLMSDEEVRAALEATEGEIRALQSERRLKDAVKILASINEEFTGTPAAAVAQQMLKVQAERNSAAMQLPTY